MDYAAYLRHEAIGPHAVFHQYLLAVSTVDARALFLFFEGDEDPSFYIPHILPRLAGREYHSYICYGRNELFKTNNLVESDGRAHGRALYFVDKDHTDFVPDEHERLPASFFQTDVYSIENYVCCDQVFRRYWVERLHLSEFDPRYEDHLQALRDLFKSFYDRSKPLMALILAGRGIGGIPATKLNLKNIQWDKVLKVDIDNLTCRFRQGALGHFLRATNLDVHSGKKSIFEIRQIIHRSLEGHQPKSYIRGKLELWFFWKILSAYTQRLSDRALCAQRGHKRATPTAPLSWESALETLGSLTSCPPALDKFLARSL